jgi:hypothetical protein
VGRAMYSKSYPKQWEAAIHCMKDSCRGKDYEDISMESKVLNLSQLKFSYDIFAKKKKRRRVQL